MNLSALNGTVLALLLMSERETGEDDWAVVGGVFRLRGARAFLDRGRDDPELEILPQWLTRIKPTDEETRPILLNASHYLPLRVADIPHGAAPGAFRATGLKWPKA